MNLKKVALGLLLSGSIFAVGCGGDDDAAGPAGGDELPAMDVPTCDTATDVGDGPARSFHINGLNIPSANTVGFNIDGLMTATSQDVAGCRRADGVPGIDNALAEIIENLAPLLVQANVDINQKLQEAVVSDAIDLDVELGSWNGMATDDCVSIKISGTSGGSAITTLNGSAALSSNVISLIAFDTSLKVVPQFLLPPDGGLGNCTVGCIEADLPITIKAVRAQIRFSAAMDQIIMEGDPNVQDGTDNATNANSTVLGGYVRFTGTDSDAFQVSLNGLITKIDPGLVETVEPIFTQYLDLDSTPTLSKCTSTGSMTTSADTFSAALLVRSAVTGL